MNPNVMRTVARLVGIGWYVAICIAGGTLVGMWLDRRLDLSPLCTLGGLGLGLAISVIGMYRLLMAVLTASDKDLGNR